MLQISTGFRAIILGSILGLSPADATLVFLDDFSEGDGTALNGKAPDIGGAWNVTTGAAGLDLNGGAVDTTGGARAAFGGFTATLGAGDVLTLSYESQEPGGVLFTGGFAGVSLFAGPTEHLFTGDTGGDVFWGVDGPASGGIQHSTDTTTGTTVNFTYTYDTGAWTFTTTSGANLAGSGTPALPLDTVRFANGNGGDIKLANISVDISNVVPEPAAATLLLFGGLLLLQRRRSAT